MNKDIIKLQKEIERLQNIALEQFEEKRIPNDKNHQRLMKLKKQLEAAKTLKEEFCIKETGNVEKRVKADIAERNRIREVEKNFDGFGRRDSKIKTSGLGLGSPFLLISNYGNLGKYKKKSVSCSFIWKYRTHRTKEHLSRKEAAGASESRGNLSDERKYDLYNRLIDVFNDINQDGDYDSMEQVITDALDSSDFASNFIARLGKRIASSFGI